MNLSDELIKSLKDDPDFQEFLEYIIETIENMDTLGGLDTDASDERLGEQVRARVVAKGELFKILRPFIDFAEKKERSKEEIQKAKNKYGLR